MTEVVTARTRDELAALAPTGQLLAGGTDLLVQMRSGRDVPRLIDISNLTTNEPPVVNHGDDALRITATAPLSAVVEALDGRLPGLDASAGLFGSIQIRNRATIGGNLANASPAADMFPPLVVADAAADMAGPHGTRSLPVADLVTGPGATVLEPGEWITTVTAAPPQATDGFRKLGGRQGMAISTASLAWRWRRGQDGRLHDVRLALGAVAPTVVRARAAEAELEGQYPHGRAVERAVAALQQDMSPIGDVRAGAWYRRAAVGGLLHEVLAAADGEPSRRESKEESWTSA